MRYPTLAIVHPLQLTLLRKVLNMKVPMFFAKKGHWGEDGMIRVSFFKYLTLVLDYVTKVRWVKYKRSM